MTDNLREIARHVANGPHHPSCPKASIQTSEYRCTCVKGRARAALAAAPQPAPVDREALVRLLQIITRNGSLDDGRTLHEVIADALLARGLRLPSQDDALQQLADLGQQADRASETMAWAVVGEDGEILLNSVKKDRSKAERYIFDASERVCRVAIRVVEDGGDEGGRGGVMSCHAYR